jgi:hypothetical protein
MTGGSVRWGFPATRADGLHRWQALAILVGLCLALALSHSFRTSTAVAEFNHEREVNQPDFSDTKLTYRKARYRRRRLL